MTNEIDLDMLKFLVEMKLRDEREYEEYMKKIREVTLDLISIMKEAM